MLVNYGGDDCAPSARVAARSRLHGAIYVRTMLLVGGDMIDLTFASDMMLPHSKRARTMRMARISGDLSRKSRRFFAVRLY